MTLKRLLFSALLLLGLLAAQNATAQIQGFGLGPKGGLYLNGNHPMIGGVLEIPFSADITLEPSLELIIGVLNTTRIAADGNARYSFVLTGLDVSPYILAGVGVINDWNTPPNGQTFSRTSFRINAGAGVTFNTRSDIQPWGCVKAHIATEGGSDVSLQGGVNFYL